MIKFKLALRSLIFFFTFALLTSCAEPVEESAETEDGASASIESEQVPLLEVPPAEDASDRIGEIHLKLESGKTVACLQDAYYGIVTTCDWANPLEEASKR